MASLLSIRGVSVAFGGEPLLDDVSLDIAKGDRICIVGRNGCGKSTLLRILSGELEPDTGEIVRQPSLKTASLPQDVPGDIGGTVAEVVSGGAAATPSALSAITRLGLDPAAAFDSLSGGQRRRCLLARAIASGPDILLLDEPTNHLDIDTIEWLEDFLESRVPTFVFVSHDRVFLKRLARRIVDLERGKLNGWDCDYETFLRRKQQVLEDEDAVFERLGKRLRREEAWLRRGVKARTTRNEGRVRALEELRRRFEARRTAEGTGKLEIVSAAPSGTRALRMRNVTFAYRGEPPLIKDFSLDILRGERIGIIGPNGAGKSTFVKLATGELEPTSGEVVQGSNLSTVYFDQLRERLDPELSVADNVSGGHDNVYVAGRPRHVLSYLGDFLFPPDRARTPAKALSGGERTRLLLARLFLDSCNFLVLDEPTNDLDAETLDLLEEQISAFDGTVLVISHDRAFIDNVATSTLVFGGDGITRHPGGYSDWRAAMAAKAQAARESAAKAEAPRRPAEKAAPDGGSQRKLSYKEKREYESLPGRIEELEKEEAELNARLSDPEVFRKSPAEIRAWHDRVNAIPAEIERLMERWAELEERA